jgi:hypothetical protein
MKEKTLYIIGIIGAVICFIGDNLLGHYTPSADFGSRILQISFSHEWAGVNPNFFALAGFCGVISLLMMFAGFYGIYYRLSKLTNYLAKPFLFSSFIFVSVGILYHNVFAIAAYMYNGLSAYHEAEKLIMDMFHTFILVSFLAVAGYIGIVVILFISSMKGNIFSHKWMCVINPLIIMVISIIISKILPQNAFNNGVFGFGQQSIGFFIIFMVLYFSCKEDSF